MTRPLRAPLSLPPMPSRSVRFGSLLAACFLVGTIACNHDQILSPDGQIISSTPTGSADGNLHTYVLDVDGASSLIVTPAGHAILFDAGADTSGTKLLAALTAHGVHGLDLVVISHRHANHEGGLVALVNAKMPIRAIMVSATPSVDRRMLAVESAWQRSGARIFTPRDTIIAYPDSARIRTVPSPLDTNPDTAAVPQDDRGIVLTATYAGRTALLQGDGSYREQEALEFAHPGLFTAGTAFLLLPDGGSCRVRTRRTRPPQPCTPMAMNVAISRRAITPHMSC
jgi:beta-lactamase superfamily II metal-dependent hydrolase